MRETKAGGVGARSTIGDAGCTVGRARRRVGLTLVIQGR